MLYRRWKPNRFTAHVISTITLLGPINCIFDHPRIEDRMTWARPPKFLRKASHIGNNPSRARVRWQLWQKCVGLLNGLISSNVAVCFYGPGVAAALVCGWQSGPSTTAAICLALSWALRLAAPIHSFFISSLYFLFLPPILFVIFIHSSYFFHLFHASCILHFHFSFYIFYIFFPFPFHFLSLSLICLH